MAIIGVLLIAGIVYFLQGKYFREHWQRGLKVALYFQEKAVRAGGKCYLREEVMNGKRMPLPALQVKFQADSSFRFQEEKNAVTTDYYYRQDLFSVGGRQKVTRKLEFVAGKRGYYQIPQLDVLVKDFLLQSQYSMRMENETALYVYPAKCDTSAFELFYRQIMGEFLARRCMEEDPFAFRGIREYRPKDSMRRVNWKSSARTGKLLVNMFETTFSQQVCILLDGIPRSVFNRKKLQEASISIASSVAGRLLADGIPVSFKTNLTDILTGEVIRVESGSGSRHGECLDRNLARANTEAGGEDFLTIMKQGLEEVGKDVCCIVISGGWNEEMLKEWERLKQSGMELYGILPYCKEEETEIPRGICGWEV